jgi:Domain of Unknown Function (DUF349)
MTSRTHNRPLSRLFRPETPLSPSMSERIAALDATSAEQLAALALADAEDAVRAAAIERLPYGESLRALAGLRPSATPSPEFAPLAQQRLASLIDEQAIPWARVRADSENTWALVQVAELCSDPAYLEQAMASLEDPQQLITLVLEGASLRLRQLAAQRIEEREDLNRLLKQLHGKEKSVYRILKDKRDALRAEAQKATHVEQDIRTIYTSLEALLSRPYDALFPPALEHFEARWRTFEGQAQPWARERVQVAIDRCRAVLDGQLREAEEHAARLAEHSARQAAQQRAREEADAQAAEAARARSEAETLAAAEAEELRQAEAKALAERRAAEALAFRQIATLMARAHGALRAGHTGPAAGLRRAIEEKCATAPALPTSLARGLQELDAKLHTLKEWKDYAVSPKRAELIAEMEALAGSSESPKKLAERIKDLRAQWKTISQGVVVDSEADWQRFNQAALIAYEPCRAYFEAQSRLRAENVDKRQHVLERLLAFESKHNGEHPDWRAIGAVLYEAPMEWRRIGPVDRRAVRALEEQFDASLARLRGRLESRHAQNAADKRALIERARGLLGKADGREAAEGAKALQQHWREIGPASRDEEGSLWNEFREQCDNVFKKRQQAFAEHAAGLESHKAQALKLCEDVEQLAAQSGAALLEGAKGMAQWLTAFEALGELPRADARTLQARFNRAVTQCELKVRGQHTQDAAQLFENLIEATQRIHAYGWTVASESAATEGESLKSEAESYIAGVAQWPKGGAALLKEAWAKAEAAGNADLAANESALRLLCIRAEIATERPTPAEDQALRRSYQLQRLVQGMGQGHEPTAFDWDALAREWVCVGPVSPATRSVLLTRFRQCRHKA